VDAAEEAGREDVAFGRRDRPGSVAGDAPPLAFINISVENDLKT